MRKYGGELLNKEKLLKLINTAEDDIHDFKETWYESDCDNSAKSEMLKDILSFVNTTHDKACYLIFGVADKTREIVGVENDTNRYNTQQITDWLSKLPIEPEIPEVKINTVDIQGHKVDVMTILNTDKVPVFLRSALRKKGYGKHPITPGQIFTRKQDTNTSISGTADYNQVENLFKKHLGLNRSIRDRFKKILKDWKNWHYYEYTNEVGLQYLIDPDFKVIFIDRDSDVKATSYSLSQWRVDISKETAQLKYKSNIIKEINVVNLDGGRFKAVIPDIGYIRNSGEELYYNYYQHDSLKFYLEQLINSINSAISPDSASRIKFMNNVVIYEDSSQQKEIEYYIKSIPVDSFSHPSKEEVERYKSKLEFDLPRSSLELNMEAIKAMAKQMKLTKYIKSILTN